MKKISYLIVFLFLLTGCNEWISKKPPIHMNPNLDFQANIKAQEDPELPPENVIPWGQEADFMNSQNREKIIASSDNYSFFHGKTKNGDWVKTVPINVNYETLQRGEQRYNIYCTMCHGKDGSGNGIVMEYGWFYPKPYWDDSIIAYADGELFNIISNGIRSMPGYSQQIPEEDRWAIVTYLRAIQIANKMPINDVPEELKLQLGE